MTLDEFYYQVAVRKPLELTHGGKTYNLTYGTDG